MTDVILSGLQVSGESRVADLQKPSFQSHQCGPGTPAVCTHALHRILVSAGLPTRGLRLAGMHSLRHAFATHLSEQGLPVPALSRLLGHANVKTTLAYLHGLGTGGEIAVHVARVFGGGADGAPDPAVGTPTGTPAEKPAKPAARRLNLVR